MCRVVGPAFSRRVRRGLGRIRSRNSNFPETWNGSDGDGTWAGCGESVDPMSWGRPMSFQMVERLCIYNIDFDIVGHEIYVTSIITWSTTASKTKLNGSRGQPRKRNQRINQQNAFNIFLGTYFETKFRHGIATGIRDKA